MKNSKHPTNTNLFNNDQEEAAFKNWEKNIELQLNMF